jgi:UDP:flavonoid glycosyltransferase YjiC (YdhE family)
VAVRVLLTTRGSSGHVTPLAPFGNALRGAGHEVLVAAQWRFQENVERTGLPFAPLGAPADEEWMALLPEFARLRLDEGHDRMVAEFFGDLDVRAMLPRLRELADEWRPDLIIRESWEYASTVVADERAIPLARVGLGVAGVETVSERAAAPAVDAARIAAGLPADPDGERMRATPYFSAMPSALEDPAVPQPPRTLRFRTSEAPPPAVPDDEPLVYVSFGSVTAGAHLAYYPALYRSAIDALAPLPARFLVTVGEDRDLGELGPLPANVTVERWVPQDEVLAHASAVVTHGGHGSTLGALAHGVPLAVLPLFALDQWFNAEAVDRAGAGVALGGDRLTRRAIELPSEETLARLAPAVERLLSDPGPRAAARAIADEMRALPPVGDAAPALEAIAREGGARLTRPSASA